MKIASIDVGTNTLLLLIADVDGKRINPLYNSQIIAGLGKSIDENGFIKKEGLDKILNALTEFKKIVENFNVEKIIAVGTSALREAKNRDELLKLIEEKTGIQIKVISGEEEAKLTYLGAVSGLSETMLNSKITVIDIGGGSTEIITGQGFEIKNFISLNIGTVRITKNFLKHSPPLDEEINEAKSFIKKELEKIEREIDFENSYLIGVAATVTSLAGYDLKLQSYNGEKVHLHKISFETIEKIYETFKNLTHNEIKNLSPILNGREDVIFAGVLILFEFMRKFDFKEIIANDRGVRYGAIINVASGDFL